MKFPMKIKKKMIFLKNSKLWRRTFLVGRKTCAYSLKKRLLAWKIESRRLFPGRAAIMVKLLGLDENHISAVYEITGSKKVHNYVPGPKYRYCQSQNFMLPRIFLYQSLNLAWHLPSEVRANLKKNGYLGEVFDIKEAQFGEEPVIPE